MGGAARYDRLLFPGANKYLSGAVPFGTLVPEHGAHLALWATEDLTSQPADAAPPTRIIRHSRAKDFLVSIDEQKKHMREAAISARRARHRGDDAGATSLHEQFMAALPEMTGPEPVVSGFWPIGEEIDVRKLLSALADSGITCALPVVVGPRKPLVFRGWAPGDPLLPGVFGTQVPSGDARALRPDIVLTPFLAADTRGFRLGYGGGYYDRTLHDLRESGTVLAVGIGYDEQIVDAVPHDESDERLDWIVTQKRAIRCGV